MTDFDFHTLNTQEYVPTKIHFRQHTMPVADLRAYIISKFSNEQMEALLDAEMVNQITVLGLPRDAARDWLNFHDFTITRTFERESRKGKKYNNIRSAMFDCHKDEKRFVFFNAFPTREYVIQVTDVISAFSQWKMNKACKVKAILFPDLEDLNWTGFSNIESHLLPNDLVVFGVVDAISENLERSNFKITKTHNFGRDNMFSCFRVLTPDKSRSALFVASRETYWGSGLAKYCQFLVEAGVSHIVYCAKGGRFRDVDFAHQIFVPLGYATIHKGVDGKERLTNVNNADLRSLFRTELHHLCFHAEMGLHLSVPSVIGETKQQSEFYKQCAPATIDNEIAYAARAIQEANKKLGVSTTFDTAHFITDVLLQDRKKAAFLKSQVPRLADKEAFNENLREEKRRKFEIISSLVAAAIMSRGHLQAGTGSMIMKTMTEPEYVGDWVDNIQSRAASPIDAANFLLAFIWWYAYGGINGDALAKDLVSDSRRLAQRYSRRPEGPVLLDSVFLLESALKYYKFRKDPKLRFDQSDALPELQELIDEVRIGQWNEKFESLGDKSNIKALQNAIYGNIMIVLCMYSMIVAIRQRNYKAFNRYYSDAKRYIKSYLNSRDYIADYGDRAINTANFHRDAMNASINIKNTLESEKLSWDFSPLEAEFESPDDVWAYFKNEAQNYRNKSQRPPTFLMYEMYFFLISMIRGGHKFEGLEQILLGLNEFLKVEEQRNWAYERLKSHTLAYKKMH